MAVQTYEVHPDEVKNEMPIDERSYYPPTEIFNEDIFGLITTIDFVVEIRNSAARVNSILESKKIDPDEIFANRLGVYENAYLNIRKLIIDLTALEMMRSHTTGSVSWIENKQKVVDQKFKELHLQQFIALGTAASKNKAFLSNVKSNGVSSQKHESCFGSNLF